MNDDYLESLYKSGWAKFNIIENKQLDNWGYGSDDYIKWKDYFNCFNTIILNRK